MESHKTHTHPEIPETQEKVQRQTTAIYTTNRDAIQIPLPTYRYGAIRRERFAFGRITQSQARKSTANFVKLNSNSSEDIPVPETSEGEDVAQEEEEEENVSFLRTHLT